MKAIKCLKEARAYGNSEFSEGNFDAALIQYRRALSVIDCPRSCRSVLLSNCAAALLKLGRNIEAKECAEGAIDVDITFAKVKG